MPTWTLPENISDVLPSEARKIEEMRRALLDNFRGFGYEFVIPPLLEYADHFVSKDLAKKTFRWLDTHSQKILAVRADITPQIARIDAHLLNRPTITRLCYADSVLHTQTHAYDTRQPIQIGAELYGSADIHADIEVTQLLLKSLSTLELNTQHPLCFSISHAGLYQALGIHQNDKDQDHGIYAMVKTKCYGEIRDTGHAHADFLYKLLRTHQPDACIQLLKNYADVDLSSIAHDIQVLHQSLSLQQQQNMVDIHVLVDISDIESYSYHTGLSFGVYVQEHPYVIARGGRYDTIAAQYHKHRPATGFSMNLRQLSALSSLHVSNHAIYAPWGINDINLVKLLEQLRAQGNIVVALPSLDHAMSVDEFVFTQKIIQKDGQWLLEEIV